ncbi:tRNA (adenosine(37)-N6)-dimethylallyltransferase MiaA [[Clostridium] fimetarium]|uniref:tRNA dimethylallyltransferase n=1 Tax=[Clostridium] fimetarium TaxID=99656 RepID=A0A1I0QJM3_9FIRM|nr:tRNA (adenosine(37)-N6)-dimethylallyltransferase MiaA [[Clostridium] fimetarium]SEW27222.1 tRNA dimethylallyltransferase [[Clostridium] fimetarium]
MNKKPLIILTGPTAVGKTELSIKLAKAIGGEIISADSMQIYKHMDIGTAKIMPEEMDGVTHFLVDELEPNEEFNVVKFKEMADKAIEQIYSRNHIPIIVGGTGFYIQAILYDIDFTENENDDGYRHELEKIGTENGAQYLHEILKTVDEKSAENIHANNMKRVIRALEYFHQTGEQISKHNEEQMQKQSTYNFIYFVLNNNRDILYDRINKRIDTMIEKGLIDEVKKLKDIGCTKEMVSMQGLGYKELLDYLDGNIELEEAIYILKRDTRHFAKRQLTWFKREPDVVWMDYSKYNNDCDEMLEKMLDIITEKNIFAN